MEKTIQPIELIYPKVSPISDQVALLLEDVFRGGAIARAEIENIEAKKCRVETLPTFDMFRKKMSAGVLETSAVPDEWWVGLDALVATVARDKAFRFASHLPADAKVDRQTWERISYARSNRFLKRKWPML